VEFRIDGPIFNECAAIGIYIEGPLPPISYRCYVGVPDFTALCPNTRATVTLSSQQVVAANDTAGNHFFKCILTKKIDRSFGCSQFQYDWQMRAGSAVLGSD